MAYNEHPRWTPEQTLVREWLWSIAALEPPSREGSNIERALGLIDRYEDTPLCKLRVFQAEANYLMGGKCRAHVCWMVCRLMELQHGLLADNLDTTASASSLFYGQRIGTCNHNTTHEVDAITDVIPNSIYRHLKHLLELISTLAYMCKTLSEYSDPMMDDEGDTTRQAKDMEAERLMRAIKRLRQEAAAVIAPHLPPPFSDYDIRWRLGTVDRASTFTTDPDDFTGDPNRIWLCWLILEVLS